MHRTLTPSVRCCAPQQQPQPPPVNKFDAHRQKVKALIKNASEKRIEFEKNSLEKIANWQSNMKQIIKEDIQLIKIVLTGKNDIEP